MAESRRFPALDPEPPPRSLLFRLLSAGALLAAAGAVAAAGFFVAGVGGRPGPPGASAGGAPGRVLSLGATGELQVTNPEGGRQEVLAHLGTYRQDQDDSVSPDGAYVVMDDGTILSVLSGKVSIRARLVMPPGTVASYISPFSHHDRAVLAQQVGSGGEPLGSGRLWIVPVAGGRSIDLGSAAFGAGDPEADGAFVSVAAPGAVASATTGIVAIGAVQLRDAGRAPVTIATSAEVARDLAIPAGPLSLVPFPDPSGAEVALAVIPAALAGEGGVVVIDRSGRLLSTTHVEVDQGGLSLVWSPDGEALAFTQDSDQGVELTVWRPLAAPSQGAGSTATTQLFPDDPAAAGGCIWSPDSSWVLCQSSSGGGPSASSWELGRVGGSIVTLPGPGDPVAWTGR